MSTTVTQPITRSASGPARELARHVVIELSGCLVLVLGMVVAESTGTRWAPLVDAGLLALLVGVGNARLGAHLNPAVSLAQWVRGRLSPVGLLVRWVSQAGGAALGALAGHALVHRHPMAQALHGRPLLHTGAGELVLTFALVWVVLGVLAQRPAEHPMPENPMSEGRAHQLVTTVALLAVVLMLTVGHLSGVALNPAMVLGRGIARLSVWHGQWPLVAVELAAGVAAGLGVRLLERRPERRRTTGPAADDSTEEPTGH